MSWNYRVVRSVEPDGTKHYEIREAYYKTHDDTHPWTITSNGVRPGGSTLLELRKDLTLMLAAFSQSPLDDTQFPSHGQPMSVDAVDPHVGSEGTPSTRALSSSSSSTSDQADVGPQARGITAPTMADAAEMLWVVLANVSGGDWTLQTAEWQEAAARWRDHYFAAVKASGTVSQAQEKA